MNRQAFALMFPPKEKRIQFFIRKRIQSFIRKRIQFFIKKNDTIFYENMNTELQMVKNMLRTCRGYTKALTD